MTSKWLRSLVLRRPKNPPRASPVYHCAERVEEQTIPGYRPQIYYPMTPGKILNGTYRVIGKLGFGTSSTVWLGEDMTRWRWQGRKVFALKVLTNNIAKEGALHTELKVSDCISKANPKHEGVNYLRTVTDSFELSGPDGRHIVLVYEPMRETLKTFQRRTHNTRLPGGLLKLVLYYILTGLDYLHTQCHVIHTDLKPDNILLGVESKAVFEDFIEAIAKDPGPSFAEGERLIFPTRNFANLRGAPGRPKIADFGLAVWGNGDANYNHPIQPDLFQAPEVILRAGWTYSADIWNLGVMIWDLLENRTLFEASDPSSGKYVPQLHLAEMISLLGHPPEELLRRGDKTVDYFTAGGNLILPENATTSKPSFDTAITSLDGEDKTLFIEFVKKMLQWLPEKRATAAELLEDPWLTEHGRI